MDLGWNSDEKRRCKAFQIDFTKNKKKTQQKESQVMATKNEDNRETKEHTDFLYTPRQ